MHKLHLGLVRCSLCILEKMHKLHLCSLCTKNAKDLISGLHFLSGGEGEGVLLISFSVKEKARGFCSSLSK